MHRLLERQVRKHFGADPPRDTRFEAFVGAVDTAYRADDADRALLERSIELASAELLEQNERLARDLETRKRLELELRQADKLRAVGQLASGLAHELNTPIQFISDNVSFIAEVVADLRALARAGGTLCQAMEARGIQAPELERVRAAVDAVQLEVVEPDLETALRQTQEGLTRVAQLVQAIKQFGRPDLREKVLADVNACVRETLLVSGDQLQSVADLVTDLGDVPWVHCYPGELNQVIWNLVSNAAHAIEQRFDGTQRGEIRVCTQVTDAAVIIRVTDNGTGIVPAVRARIFEPFFTTKAVGRGTGQGLAVSRSIIVDKHGGTLTFDTKPGEGTTFVVMLPLPGRAL